jgi:yersiniabactin nonribosomal peptide/polyketide synthase
LQTLRNHGGRYLILYSSAAATLGASGQSAHALACGYLDGLAQQFSTLDAPKTLSVAWGAWGKRSGGHAGNVGGARQPWHGCVKRC